MCKHAKVECQQISSANLKIFSFSRKFISGGGGGGGYRLVCQDSSGRGGGYFL